MTSLRPQREPIYCDCHGTVIMGYRLGPGEVAWFDKRHGVQHTVKVHLDNHNPMCNDEALGSER